MVRDPFTNEMIPSPTLIQEIRTTHNDISAMRTARNYQRESAMLAWCVVAFGAFGVALIGATATVHDATYVVVIAFLSAFGFGGFGVGLYTSSMAHDYTRKIKNAQRKIARLINS
jgi:hypothetical protein